MPLTVWNFVWSLILLWPFAGPPVFATRYISFATTFYINGWETEQTGQTNQNVHRQAIRSGFSLLAFEPTDLLLIPS